MTASDKEPTRTVPGTFTTGSYAPGGPVTASRRNPSHSPEPPRRSLADRLHGLLHKPNGDLRPVGYVVAYLIAAVLLFLFGLVLTFVRLSIWPPEPQQITVELDGQYMVIPTCAELDSIGYDGLATCIDADGKLVTVGAGG